MWWRWLAVFRWLLADLWAAVGQCPVHRVSSGYHWRAWLAPAPPPASGSWWWWRSSWEQALVKATLLWATLLRATLLRAALPRTALLNRTLLRATLHRTALHRTSPTLSDANHYAARPGYVYCLLRKVQITSRTHKHIQTCARAIYTDQLCYYCSIDISGRVEGATWASRAYNHCAPVSRVTTVDWRTWPIADRQLTTADWQTWPTADSCQHTCSLKRAHLHQSRRSRIYSR